MSICQTGYTLAVCHAYFTTYRLSHSWTEALAPSISSIARQSFVAWHCAGPLREVARTWATGNQHESVQAKLAARAHETRELLISRLRAEEEALQAARDGPREVGDIDTDDEQNQEVDYNEWIQREYQRIR